MRGSNLQREATIMTVAVSGASNSWINSLSSATIKADMQAMATSGSMTYNSLLTLLQDVAAQGTVTATELTDLQTVVANLNNGFSASDYLASELTQIVSGNPANAVWNIWNGSYASITGTVSGNLAVGSSATLLTQLIGDWLQGAGAPDPAPASGSTDVVTYANYSNLLPFGTANGVPAVSDVMQGALGDCVVCSAMIEMVINHLPQLQSMIVNDGNGVYGVRFFINGAEMWETVNSQLAVSNGNLYYVNASNTAGVGFWADLIEKGFAQLGATGLIDHPAVDSFQNVSGNNPALVETFFTGAQTVTYNYSDATWNSDKQIIIDALNSKEDVLLGTGAAAGDVSFDSNKNQMFISNHCFAVVGYDSTTGSFIIRNPWGAPAGGANIQGAGSVAGQGTGGGYYVQFEASMANIAAVQGYVSIDNSAVSTVAITVGSGGPIDVTLNGSVAVSKLFSIADTAGAKITQYNLQLSGTPGTIALNGATNIATSAQTAAGQIVVSAADLAKVTYSAGGTAGGNTLLLSAFDGTNWSPTANIALAANAALVSILPTFNQAVATGGTIALSSLMTVVGDQGGATDTYQVSLSSGAGVFNLNGATNYSTTANQVLVRYADLQMITFTAGATAGPVVFSVVAADGTNTWGDFQNITLQVGATAVAALTAYNNGNIAAASNVVDTAANIFANLDSLQTAVTAGVVKAIQLTDTNNPTETITSAQLANDAGVLSMINGAYTVSASIGNSMSAANVSADIDTLNAQGNLGSITLTDGGTPALTLTVAQALNDTKVLSAISSPYTIAISDTSSAATSSLTALSSGGKISSLTLTGGGANLNVLAAAIPETLVNTAGSWDGVNGSGGTIDLSSAQAQVTGGGDTINFVSGANNAVTLTGTANNWDGVNGSGGTLYLASAQAAVVGGGDTINLYSGTGNAATLSNTANNWDAVYGSGGTLYLASAQAAVVGGGDTINLYSGTGNAATLSNTANNWDAVNGSGGTLYLASAQAQVSGGGDTVNFYSGTGNAATLSNTANNWDAVNGSSGAVYLASAQAVVTGGGDTVNFYSGTGNVATLSNTANNWDAVNGSGGTLYFASAQAAVTGGGDTVNFYSGTGNVATLGGTANNWDAVNGSNGVIYFQSAQAQVSGGGDTVKFVSGTGNAATLTGTAGAWDAVYGSSSTLYLEGAQTAVFGDGNSINFISGSNEVAESGANNSYSFQPALGYQDVIDYFGSTDSISLSHLDFANWTALSGHISQSGSDTLITVNSIDTIKLTNVQASSLSSSQFHFV